MKNIKEQLELGTATENSINPPTKPTGHRSLGVAAWNFVRSVRAQAFPLRAYPR